MRRKRESLAQPPPLGNALEGHKKNLKKSPPRELSSSSRLAFV